MGKKNKGKYNKLGYLGKRDADRKMAKQYGIDVSEYGNGGRPGQHTTKKSYDQLKKDVSRAAANDYDVRRSLEAASLSGNKKAQKIGSISNASDAYAASRFMEKTHKKRMELGGAYDGANDQGAVTNYWVNKDRDKLKASFATEDQATEADPDGDSVLQDFDDPIEFEHSQKVKDAKSRVDKYTMNLGKNNLFGKVNDPVSSSNDQAAAADSFVNGYKKDLSTAANLKESKSQNINNAIDTARSIYRTQFM